MKIKLGFGARMVAFTFLVITCVQMAGAFDEPPVNLGASTFFTGGYPPGLWFVQYNQYIVGNAPKDKNGGTIPGGGSISVFAQMNQLFYMTHTKILGGYLGADVLLPYVSLTGKGSLGSMPLTANTAGLGDIILGPALQWLDGKVLGRPFSHRLELDVVLPTGKYDPAFLMNPGSNLISFEPYYAFTWLFADQWETSWWFVYTYNSKNPDTHIRPGQMVHLNYAVSRQVLPKLRLGVSGYALQQITEDTISGVSFSGSKERVFAMGPGLVYNGTGITAMLSHPVEFGAQNRFQGSRTTLQFIYKF